MSQNNEKDKKYSFLEISNKKLSIQQLDEQKAKIQEQHLKKKQKKSIFEQAKNSIEVAV